MRLSPTLRKDKERLKKDAGSSRRALRRVLPPVVAEDVAGPLVFYLSELAASTERVRRLIVQLGRVRRSDRAAVRRALASIETQVFEVIERHKSQLRKPLRKAVRQLYAERSRSGK